MNPNVILIPPVEQYLAQPDLCKKIRVGVYCRVSTDSEEQLNSYHNQISYYIGLISKEIEWEFVDIYADEGITGTKAEVRDDFNRMIEDCRKGLLDLILVKSISRFARNTLDCLKYVRELRALNVDVYFENEKIHGINASNEFLITIHAMHAQEQAISTSNNKRWSIRKQMESGIWLPTFTGYGYIIQDEEIVKDPKVKENVELIKKLYLDGYSINKIKTYLEMKEIPSPKDKGCWSERLIETILVDPLYRGHLIAQRTYKTETFPFEQRINRGELPQYHYYDDHESYINKEEADKIDEIMMTRRALNGAIPNSGKSHNRNYLSGKVMCAECGSKMKRIIRSHTKAVGYSCEKHIKDKVNCSNKTVLENTIQLAFIKVCSKLKYHKNLLEDYLKDQIIVDEYSKNHSQLENLTKQYQSVIKQIQQTAVSFNRGLCESAFYVSEIERLREEKMRIYQKQKETRGEDGCCKEIENTKMIQSLLEFYQYGNQFDEQLFEEIVDHVEAFNQKEITFHLINGLVVTEKMEV